MGDLPNKITAWVNRDGSTQFEAGQLFPQGTEAEYVPKQTLDKLANALKEITSCVEDGCYCSEMRMAAAVDNANEALLFLRQNP